MLKKFRFTFVLLLLLLTPVAATSLYYSKNLGSQAYAPQIKPPVMGNAPYFDTSNFYLTVPNSFNLKLDNRDIFKLSTWIKLSSVSNPGYKSTIISHAGPVTSYQIYIQAGRLYFELPGQTIASTQLLPTDRWINIRVETAKGAKDQQIVRLYNGYTQIGSGIIKIPTPRFYDDSRTSFSTNIGAGIRGDRDMNYGIFAGQMYDLRISGNVTVKGAWQALFTCSFIDRSGRGNTTQVVGTAKYIDVQTGKLRSQECR